MIENRRQVCHCVHKAAFGQRMLWLECLLGAGHADKHWDVKHNYRWDGPVVYWDDWEQETVAKTRQRVSKRCPRCSLYPCCCQKEAENYLGQKDIFREDPIYKANEEFHGYIDDFFERMDNDRYCGDF